VPIIIEAEDNHLVDNQEEVLTYIIEKDRWKEIKKQDQEHPTQIKEEVKKEEQSKKEKKKFH